MSTTAVIRISYKARFVPHCKTSRRGFIRVSQTSLINLGEAIDAAQSAGDQGLVPEYIPRPAVTGRR